MTPPHPARPEGPRAQSPGRSVLVDQLRAEYPETPGPAVTRVVNRAYLAAKSVTSGEENEQRIAGVLARDRLRLLQWPADQPGVADGAEAGNTRAAGSPSWAAESGG